jgi:hypothetical protein
MPSATPSHAKAASLPLALLNTPSRTLPAMRIGAAEEVVDECAGRSGIIPVPGVPSCWIFSFAHHHDAIASSSASSWSWVTKTVVYPVSSWMCRNQRRNSMRTFGIERAERFVKQQHRRVRSLS